MMRKITSLALIISVTLAVNAQQLVQKRIYSPQQFEKTKIQLTNQNKPNGNYSRLREHVTINDFPQPESALGLELFIAEPTHNGYIGLWRTPLAAPNYRFIVTLWDKNKQLLYSFDLNEITNTWSTELQDIRWAENEKIYFNMACPSYSQMLGGKCSRLYSLDVKTGKIEWQTPYLTSNDIFILHHQYIICGYGFTGEKDWLFLLDRKTGKILSKVQLPSAHSNLEIVNNHLYVTVYDDNIHEYEIK